MTADSHLDYLALKRRFGGPYRVNNGYDFARAARAIEAGSADLMVFGRLFLANPELPPRFAQGATLNQPDRDTFYRCDEQSYTSYPSL